MAKNFTSTIVSFEEYAGIDLTIAHPSTLLLLTPNIGYTLQASALSPSSPLPNYVASVTFADSGDNVECTITYVSPSIMPSVDVLVDVCIDGDAITTPTTLSGEIIDCGVSNVNITLPIAYSSSGQFAETSTVIVQSVTANAGFYFGEHPTLSIVEGVVSDYNISSSDVFNIDNQLIQVIYTIEYTFPATDAALNQICLEAVAQAIYTPTVEIVSYNYAPGVYYNTSGQTNTFSIQGIEGANWDLDVEVNLTTPFLSDSGTIDSTGAADVTVTIPSGVVGDCYTFTLTGDLSPTFDTANGQLSVFTVCQSSASGLKSIDVAYSVTSADVVCCDKPGFSQIWIDQLEDFDTAAAFYSNSSGTTPVVDGFYSFDRVSYRQQNTTLGVLTSCPSCTTPAVGYTASSTYSSSSLACASVDVITTFYFANNTPVVGETVYLDAALTIPHTGNNDWVRVDYSPVTSMKINSSGGILSPLAICFL